jgi:aryl-alcohol dehydrogenase-like predicted oxidoreductase
MHQHSNMANLMGAFHRHDPIVLKGRKLMKFRKIGSLEVSEIGLGCMGMSIAYGDRDEAASIATIHHALDRGVNFIDTADVYGNGHNEELLSRALDGHWHKTIIATKFGQRRFSDGTSDVCGTPEYVIKACDASLSRLKTDIIDLYYLHRVDKEVPIEETVGAMASLIKSGKVRHIGLSEASSQTILRAHATYPITAIQSEYSLWSREVESSVLNTCRDLGIGFVAYSPLGRGFLTGKIKALKALIPNDSRRAHPRFSEESISKNLILLETIHQVAEQHNVSPAQVAIAWVQSSGEDIVSIPGTKKIKWLEENISATELELSVEDISKLNTSFYPGVTKGDRYPAGAMKHLDH